MLSVRRYLVAYDIADPKRLDRVRKIVKGYGFGLQYSVYLCDLTEPEMYALKSQLADTILASKDRIAFVDLGDADRKGTRCFQFMGVRPHFPWGGATIV